jgi:hypothetical protein
MCVDDLADLQHTQHGPWTGLHSHDGRVARTLPHVFDPQECASGVCFGWFHSWNAILTPSLHPSGLNHHHLNQHTLKSSRVFFVKVKKP